jgi:hypothetical protein
MGIDNDEIYQIIVTKIFQNKHILYCFPLCNGKTGIEALINTIENKEPLPDILPL